MSPEPPIQEEITARLGEKASFGRKVAGVAPQNSLATPEPLNSREKYGQICRKSKIWP